MNCKCAKNAHSVYWLRIQTHIMFQDKSLIKGEGFCGRESWYIKENRNKNKCRGKKMWKSTPDVFQQKDISEAQKMYIIFYESLHLCIYILCQRLFQQKLFFYFHKGIYYTSSSMFYLSHISFMKIVFLNTVGDAFMVHQWWWL